MRLASLLLAAAITVGGCANYRLIEEGKIRTSVADDITARLVATRQLSFRTEVPITTVSSDAARTMLAREIERQYGPGEISAIGRLYTALGLLPEDSDLERAFLDLYGDQVAGFYDPIGERMVLVAEPPGKGVSTRILESILRRDLTGELILAHELTHALQDQHYGLQTGRGDDDASLARRAVYEGDATLAAFGVVMGKLKPNAAVSVAGRLEQIPEQLAKAYPGIPTAIRETLVFQYVAGANFVSWAYSEAGWPGVNALLARPPRSTEQILHPDRYFIAPEYPLTIRVGALSSYIGSGWDVVEETTLGELIIRLLTKRFIGAERAVKVADGWDGDRLTGLVYADDLALVWLTAWDTPADADEFFEAYREILTAKHPGDAPDTSQPNVISRGGAAPYYLERRVDKVLVVEGPLDGDLDQLAARIWRRSSYEAAIPWIPLDTASVLPANRSVCEAIDDPDETLGPLHGHEVP